MDISLGRFTRSEEGKKTAGSYLGWAALLAKSARGDGSAPAANEDLD